MVSGPRIDGGGTTQILSAGLRKTIQSIKEIVGNHSDGDIYAVLKETNMDPNDAAQKLLNQDPFHEVKRKKDKKKENPGHRSSAAAEPKRYTEYGGQAVKSNTYSDRNVRRLTHVRNTSSGFSREFRVVRDNRVNQNSYQDSKPVQSSTSISDPTINNASVKSTSTGVSRHAFQGSNGPTDLQSGESKDLSVPVTKDLFGERQQTVPNTAPQMLSVKPNDSEIPSTALLNNSVVGVYSSSSDPVHVPSPDSRAASKIGAIKREVGAVGAHRQNSDPSARFSSSQTSSFSNLHLGREGSSSRESPRSFGSVSKGDQSGQNAPPESAAMTRSFPNSQYTGRGHQLMGHPKAAQPNKEWKPKSSQKPAVNDPGIIGMPTSAAASPVDNSKDVGSEAAQLEDKLSCVNMSDNQNVIIAAHIRVSETDRCRLTFGSLGADFETRKSGFQAVPNGEETNMEPSGCLPASSAPESSPNDSVSSKPQDSIDDHVRNSGSGSPASVSLSDHQLLDKKEASNTQNLENYPGVGLVQDNSASYVPPDSQQRQDTSELPNFSAYDAQTGYDISYFGPTVDEHIRGQGLPSPQEVLSSHAANGIPPSSMAMVQQQQQQQPMAQMYPQLHVSHFANLLPYRQYLSPVYVPPMAVPGYSSNPAYPHPSNGSSYVLMPGTSSHLTASGLKYGIQQFKPVPAGSPTGFGNFTNPAGYAVNAPGVVGSATGLEDSSRLKFKDGNVYLPNPQAETSEIWMNPRDLQSASYYNMPGQTPHAAYLPSHSSHASYNAAAAVAQSSHMQFPGLYHPPPQPAAIANPHHLGAAMGGNVGVAAAAPGGQVGAYQHSQLGHLSWTGNF